MNLVSKEFLKNKKFNQLNMKENNSEKKIPDMTSLIHKNQYNTDNQSWKKKLGDVDKKIPYVSGAVTKTILNTKISGVENKIQDTSQENRMYQKLKYQTLLFKHKTCNICNKAKLKAEQDKIVKIHAFNLSYFCG